MKVAITLLILSCFCLTANADLIALFENDNVVPGDTSTPVDMEHADVTVGGFSLGSGLASAGWSDSLSSFVHTLTSDLSGAITADDYFTFTVTPDGGKQMNFSSLFSRVAVNGLVANTSVHLTLMSSEDGFVSGNEYETFEAISVTGDATDNLHSFDLTGESSLQSVSSAVEFRFYVYKGTGTPNRFGFGHVSFNEGADDVLLSGTVISAVPEVSAAIALPFVMGLVGFGKLSRRRRREEMAS